MRNLPNLLLLLVTAGCAQLPPADQTSWQCEDGFRFATRGGGEEITLIFPDRTLVLPRVRSGSGEKYTDRKLLYWNKGKEAILSSGHGMLRCQPGS